VRRECTTHLPCTVTLLVISQYPLSMCGMHARGTVLSMLTLTNALTPCNNLTMHQQQRVEECFTKHSQHRNLQQVCTRRSSTPLLAA
jgi:hypothetical protein